MSRRPLRIGVLAAVLASLAMPLGARGASIPSFTAPISARVGGGPVALAATALNRDRYPDLVVLTPGRVTPLLGRGDGTFRRGRPVPVSYSALAVAVGDLNGDRRADVAVAGWDAPIEPSSTGVVNVLLGDGRGGLRRAGTLPVAGRSIAVTDVSGDGRPDLVLAGSAADVRGPGTASILLGNGDGSFSGTLAVPIGGNPPLSVLAADLNGDGIPDLVGATGDTGLFVRLGAGAGEFRPQVFYVTGWPIPSYGLPALDSVGLVAADLTGDGRLDVALARNVGDVSVLLAQGDPGALGPATTFAAGRRPDAIAAADLNGDGAPDLVVGNAGTQVVSVLLGTGGGGFSNPVGYRSGSDPRAVVAADLNGDRRIDIAVANQGGKSVSALLNAPARPVLFALDASPSAFRVPPCAVRPGRHCRAATMLSFSLSGPASVRFSVRRGSHGPVVGHLTASGVTGANRLPFTARFSGRALRPGPYTLAARPSSRLGAGRPVTVRLRVRV